MEITKEFLEAEIAHLDQERRKAYEFTIKASATIDAYRMLCARLDEPENSQENTVQENESQ